MRKFFKTVFEIEVLSEDRPLYEDMSLNEINYSMNEDCVGVVKRTAVIELTDKEVSAELLKMGSEPGFFQLEEEQT